MHCVIDLGLGADAKGLTDQPTPPLPGCVGWEEEVNVKGQRWTAPFPTSLPTLHRTGFPGSECGWRPI